MLPNGGEKQNEAGLLVIWSRVARQLLWIESRESLNEEGGMNSKKPTCAERKQSISDVHFKGTKERRNVACLRYKKRHLWLEHSWGDGAMVEDQVSDPNNGKEFLLPCIGSQWMILKRGKA